MLQIQGLPLSRYALFFYYTDIVLVSFFYSFLFFSLYEQ
nr:MAG TPA: hypothetical protein [Caudoviricetes sp.]